jgi:ABC-type transport system involved in multi-copper enzyme maturation permease subunit
MLTKITGVLSIIALAVLTGLFTYMTILTGTSPLPSDPVLAAAQIMSFVILAAASIAAAALVAVFYKELCDAFS